MSRLRTAALFAGCLGLIGSAATAQEQPASQALTIGQVRMMDADRDGRITREEFLKLSSDRDLFAQLDTNFDGALDAEEQRRGIRAPIRTIR